MIDIPGKIPIRIHPYFWLISVLIGWLSTENVLLTLLWAGVIFLSILFHEFGHALTAMLFGQKATIDLVAMGGLTQRSGPPLKLWQEFILVLNGPLAGFLLYFISSSLKKHMSLQGYPLISYSLVVAIYINWYWTLINLIPIQPMDGGRLFSLFMEYFFGFKGVKIALFTSMILAAILGALCFYLNFLFAGVLLFMFMFDTYRHWKESLRISDRDHQPDLQLLYQQGKQELESGQLKEAFQKFKQIREIAGNGLLFLGSTQMMAEILAKQNKTQEAIDLLSPIEKKLSPDGLQLLQHLLYEKRDFTKCAEVGKKAYQNKPNYDSALLNACSFAQMGEVTPAVGWLECSIREGLPNPRTVIQSKEFDSIRQDPLFRELESTQ